MAGMWAFVVIGGPILLLAALVIGYLTNRKSRVPMSVTEDAPRRNREEDAAADRQHQNR